MKFTMTKKLLIFTLPLILIGCSSVPTPEELHAEEVRHEIRMEAQKQNFELEKERVKNEKLWCQNDEYGEQIREECKIILNN